MKSRLLNLTPEEIKSLPVRGAWVEMGRGALRL